MLRWKLLFFRFLLEIIGPLPGGSKLVRFILMRMIRRDGRITYVAHSSFFDIREADLKDRSLYSHSKYQKKV
jgi:hypothetical protein